MSAARPGTAGATRTCPHCRATILASSATCPQCKGHLRYDAAPDRKSRTRARAGQELRELRVDFTADSLQVR